MWSDHQLAILASEVVSSNNPQECFVDFYTFKQWAVNSINIYQLLSVFELVPSPSREHEIINKILEKYERKHGDKMYCLSYRWWDTWKEYTEKHFSTLEMEQYID